MSCTHCNLSLLCVRRSTVSCAFIFRNLWTNGGQRSQEYLMSALQCFVWLITRASLGNCTREGREAVCSSEVILPVSFIDMICCVSARLKCQQELCYMFCWVMYLHHPKCCSKPREVCNFTQGLLLTLHTRGVRKEVSRLKLQNTNSVRDHFSLRQVKTTIPMIPHYL